MNYTAHHHLGDFKLITPEDFAANKAYSKISNGDYDYHANYFIEKGYIDGGDLYIIVSGWDVLDPSRTFDEELWHVNPYKENYQINSADQWPVDMAVKIREKTTDANVFVWDWTAWSCNLSIAAPIMAAASGAELAYLLSEYIRVHPDHGDIHLIGFSNGGHVSLQAANDLEDVYKINVDQVTLLDPVPWAFLGNMTLKDKFFIDHYASAVSFVAGPGNDGNANVCIDNFSDHVVEADFKAYEWYLNQSIEHYGISQNTYGFYWAEHPESRANLTSYYTGNPASFLLTSANYITYTFNNFGNLVLNLFSSVDDVAYIAMEGSYNFLDIYYNNFLNNLFNYNSIDVMESAKAIVDFSASRASEVLDLGAWVLDYFTEQTVDMVNQYSDKMVSWTEKKIAQGIDTAISFGNDYVNDMITGVAAVITAEEWAAYKTAQGIDAAITVEAWMADQIALGIEKSIEKSSLMAEKLYQGAATAVKASADFGVKLKESIAAAADAVVAKLSPHSPIYLYSNVIFPEERNYYMLEYAVAAADVDSYLAVMIDDQVLYSAKLQPDVGKIITTEPICFGDYAGTTKTLTILVNKPDGGADTEVDLLNFSALKTTSPLAYDFTFSYETGDSYQGILYADSSHKYTLGYESSVSDELGEKVGTYRISGLRPTQGDFAKNGQVFVTSYTDSESNRTYTPLNSEVALGAGYLGSEHGCIIRENVSEYLFGHQNGKFHEADVGDRYTFRYTYGNGDYYEGYVYRSPEVEGYYPGWKSEFQNETGKFGNYEIISASYSGDASKYGQVYVDTYHDAESNKNFTPLHKSQAVGTALLGSEQDYICQDGVKDYQFGKGYTEADVGDRYLFRYTYGNGDYYEGTVYRAPGVGYYPGRLIEKKNETGKTGYYEILSMTYTGDKTKYNQVFVDTYHDGETNKDYTPLHKGQAVGTALLGSEQDYICQDGVKDYQFGKGCTEADVGDKYAFKYYYGNGDYYQGTVYRAPGVGYYPGRIIEKKNETGITGYYEILSMTYTGEKTKYNQVFVDTYHDGESNKNFSPLHKGQAVGTALLGSELDYICQDGVKDYQFGKGYTEADVGDKYTFRYTYGNGDYYQGTVYRAPGVGYYPGRIIERKNETGKTGYYEFLSMTYTGEKTKYGQVYVDLYKDGESGRSYAPLKKGQAVGTALLGSEQDSICQDGVTAYKFGKGYTEADVGDKYAFKYYYGNGDFYQGYVYRTPGVGYYPGRIIEKKNELGLTGYYEILSMAYTGDTAKYNQVYVTRYHDGDRPTPKTLTPVNCTNPLGIKLFRQRSGLHPRRRPPGPLLRQRLLRSR